MMSPQSTKEFDMADYNLFDHLGDLSTVPNETISAWFGGSLIRQAPRDPADVAFEDEVFRLIENRQVPTAEALADATGVSQDEAAAWLAQYTKFSYKSLAEERQARASEQTKLGNLHRHYQLALRQAQQILKQDRAARGLPEPDVHDPMINNEDPLIQEVLVSERRLKEFERENHHSLLSYVIPPDPFAERRGVEATLRDIQDAARSVARAAEGVARLEEQLAQLPMHIAEQRQVYERTYSRLVFQHAEFWRCTGALPDVRLPIRLEDRAETETDRVE
jgi:hypothetical protein